MTMKSSLCRLRLAGFRFRIADGYVEAAPASALTQQHRDFIKAHMAEIMNELKAEQQQCDLLTAERAALEIIRQFSNRFEVARQ
jgi:hypothetical protein